MNIKICDELAAKTAEVERLLIDIEMQLGFIAPDLKSTIAAKRNVLAILHGLYVLRQDIKAFRSGQSVEEAMEAKFKDIFPKGFFEGLGGH